MHCSEGSLFFNEKKLPQHIYLKKIAHTCKVRLERSMNLQQIFLNIRIYSRKCGFEFPHAEKITIFSVLLPSLLYPLTFHTFPSPCFLASWNCFSIHILISFTLPPCLILGQSQTPISQKAQVWKPVYKKSPWSHHPSLPPHPLIFTEMARS